MAPGLKKIIIVGAGPAGQILALLLGKEGIPVTILDQESKLDDRPRATHYAAPAMRILNSAGVGDDLRSKGFLPDTVAWRKPDGTYLTGLHNGIFKGDKERMVCLPLSELADVIYSHCTKIPTITYLFNHRVTGIGQDEQKAWVNATNTESQQEHCLEADYIIGCDGASSIIRRSLFGDREFPGKTWDEQIVATNVYYDFEKFGYCDSNFIIDPEHWFMAAKITTDGMWRVTYGEASGLTNDELLARQPEKFQIMLPGHPTPENYEIKSISPYKVHQRLAAEMRVGRFLLAADAAHLCNPFGGLGLTGGIMDVGGLSQCLVGLYHNKADETILDKYSEIRRRKYQEIIDPVSSENLRRMFSIHPEEVLEKDEFLQLCQRAEKDQDFAKEFMLGIYALDYDFTQHYNIQTSCVGSGETNSNLDNHPNL